MRLPRLCLPLLLATALAQPAVAAGPGAVRRQVESSRVVTGTLDIDREGRVAGYALENADDLPAEVGNLFARTLPQWRFEPVRLPEGSTLARTRMSLRLVAKKLDGDRYTIEIRGAQFGSAEPGEEVALAERPKPPAYPASAIERGVGGKVYIAVMVARDGRVSQAIAEQVNLRLIASEQAMARWRDVLAKAALRVAREYRFAPPTKGPHADAPYWSVRIPLEFIIGDAAPPDDTKWHAYVPGPRADVPWIEDEERQAADAMAGTGIQPLGSGYRLLTPLQPAGS